MRVNRGFYHHETLPNGIRVLVEDISYVRSVTVGIWVAAGSRFEEARQVGITHLIEHLLFKGTERRTAREIAESMDAIGGQLNAFTSKEHTCYYARVLDQHLQEALDLLSDMLLNSRFDAEDLNREKGVVLEEIKMYEDAPDELVHDLFAGAIWTNHPLGRNIVGTAPIVSSLERRDILEYFRQHYVPANVVVSIAGNVREGTAVDLVSRYLGEMRAVADQRPAEWGVPPQARSGLNIRDKDIEQVHLCLGTMGVPQDHDDMYPLYVLNNCLGGGPSSRLFQEIRESRGLAYSVYSYLSSYRDAGLFAIYAGTSPDNSAQVVELTLNEIRRLKREGLTREELHRAKEQMKGQLMLSLESTSNRMTRLGRSELTLGKVYSPDEVIEKVEAVTMEDTVSLAERLLDGTLTLAAVGPPQKDTGLAEVELKL